MIFYCLEDGVLWQEATMKRLLILGASEFQIPLLLQAKKMDIYTCVVDINENAKGFLYADEYRVCSIKDVEGIYSIAIGFKPDGISAGMCDVAVRTTAEICERLGLPGLAPNVARTASDKFLMIEAFKKSGVPHPFYMYVNSVEDLEKIERNIPIPAISKPVDMAGSRGINYIESLEQLDEAVKKSMSCSDTGKVLLEEYMSGPEVSVEIVVKEKQPYVLQITDKLTSGRPHFMELGHSQPSKLSEFAKKEISNVACAAVKSLSLDNCIVHAEIIITQEGPKMVELGARMGGDAIHQYLIEYSTGINLQEVAINIALGYEFNIPVQTINLGSAIRFIESQPGKVKSVICSNNFESKVKRVEIFCKVGDKFFEAKDNSGRFGYVIAQAETSDEAISICERTIQSISIEME